MAVPLLHLAQSLPPKPTPESVAGKIVADIENTLGNIGEGKFVLITFMNGSVEIVSMVKPAKDWDDEYRKSLEAKIVLTIARGGTTFQLIQIREKEKVLV